MKLTDFDETSRKLMKFEENCLAAEVPGPAGQARGGDRGRERGVAGEAREAHEGWPPASGSERSESVAMRSSTHGLPFRLSFCRSRPFTHLPGHSLAMTLPYLTHS